MTMRGSGALVAATIAVNDQATAPIENITASMLKLRASAVVTAAGLREIGTSVTAIRIGGRVVPQLQDLGDRIQAMGMKGGATTQQIQRLSNELAILSTTLPQGTPKVMEMSNALIRLGANSKLATQEAARMGKQIQASTTQAANGLNNLGAASQSMGRRMTFMGDVSEGSAKMMRTVSAGSQGAMLSMAALQKNIIGVAFSLIFLQFSGALKVSLAFAALIGVSGLVYLALKKIIGQRSEMEKLADAFEIVTDSSQAMGLATEKAEDFVKKLSFTGKLAKDTIKGLEKVQVELLNKGLEPSNEALRVFIERFVLAKESGLGMEESLGLATKAAVEAAKQIKEAGEVTDITLFGEQQSVERLHTMFISLLKKLKREGKLATRSIVDDMLDEMEELGAFVPPGFRPSAFLGRTQTLEELMGVGPPGQLQKEFEKVGGDWEEFWDKWIEIEKRRTSETTDVIETMVDNAFAPLEVSLDSTKEKSKVVVESMIKDWGDFVNFIGLALVPGFDAIQDALKQFQTDIADPGLPDLVGGDPTLSGAVAVAAGGGVLGGRTPINNMTINIDVHDNEVSNPDELASRIAQDVMNAMYRGNDFITMPLMS